MKIKNGFETRLIQDEFDLNGEPLDEASIRIETFALVKINGKNFIGELDGPDSTNKTGYTIIFTTTQEPFKFGDAVSISKSHIFNVGDDPTLF